MVYTLVQKSRDFVFKVCIEWHAASYVCMYVILCYLMVWYGMVWYGMVWYGMVWYGICCYIVY